jgi:hypothetical protein
MIRLSSSVSVEIVLGGAVATAQPHVTVSCYDVPNQTKEDSSEYRGTTFLNKTNNTTLVSICAAPPIVGTVRNIDYICVFNVDSASVTPTIRLNDGTTTFTQYSQAVASGKSLVYESGSGWQVI